MYLLNFNYNTGKWYAELDDMSLSEYYINKFVDWDLRLVLVSY